jgi:uncharacterized protein YlxW (UPF0749 family)
MTEKPPEKPDIKKAADPAPDASLDYGFRPASDGVDPDDETLLIAGHKVGGRVEEEDERADASTPSTPSSTLPREQPGFGPPPAGLSGLLAALRIRRAAPTQLVIAVLCGLLGFFAVVQLRLQADDNNLRSARQSDLIRILDDLNDRSERLDSEISDLEQRRIELQSGSDRSKAALTEAEGRRAVLGILAGTVPARGPGILLRIEDPQQKVDAAVLLDTLQELRDAGAEAVQINDVRVVASTDFLDAAPGSVQIDGQVVAAPYLFKVIGDPDTLDPALRIPGGVFAVLGDRGAAPTVEARRQVTVDATRPATDLDYARPNGS